MDVVHDRVGDQSAALVADLVVQIRSACQFLLAANLGDGPAQLVIRRDAVLRAVHRVLQLWGAQVAQRVADVAAA